MSTLVTADNFFDGIMAALARRGQKSISMRYGRFERGLERAFTELERVADDRGVEPDFFIVLHPVHGDSVTIKEALTNAIQDDIVGLDNPEFQDLRIKLDADDAEHFFEWLPGGVELYDDLARVFLDEFAAA